MQICTDAALRGLTGRVMAWVGALLEVGKSPHNLPGRVVG